MSLRTGSYLEVSSFKIDLVVKIKIVLIEVNIIKAYSSKKCTPKYSGVKNSRTAFNNCINMTFFQKHYPYPRFYFLLVVFFIPANFFSNFDVYLFAPKQTRGNILQSYICSRLSYMHITFYWEICQTCVHLRFI